MEWIDYVKDVIGVLLGVGALWNLGSKLYAKFKNGSEFRFWFGRRRKVKELKYVSISRNAVLLARGMKHQIQ